MSTTEITGLEFTAPIELACSTDGTRPALGYVTIKDGWAWATDSYVMARVATAREDHQLPAAALNAARKRSSYHPSWIAADNMVHVQKGDVELTYPNPPIQAPDYTRVWEPAVTTTDTFIVALDAKKLYDLARALGADRHGKHHCQVEITFNAANAAKPIYVQPCEATGAEGILMPVRRTKP